MATLPSPGGSPTGTMANSSGLEQQPTEATTSERPSSHKESFPDDKCAICLGPVRNKAFPDGCNHHFCFSCLVE
ncbi:hypothetical protein MRX96_028171 [Rhipicephalus microplus]